MDDKERDEILYRLDERTKRVDDHLNRLDKRVAQNEESIEDLHDEVQSNADDISTAKKVLGGLVTLLSGALAKVFKVI